MNFGSFFFAEIRRTMSSFKPGGAASTVTVSLNSAASNFLIGNYSANVSIVDLGDGTAQNRQFDLYAGNGGFESGDFTDWTLVGNTNLDIVLAADDVDVAGTNQLTGAADALFVHSGLYGAYLGEAPADGSLSQAVATTPGQKYLVSFWLTSVPSNGVTIPNNFAATWNGSTLYAQTNLGAFGWTNLQYVVPATRALTTLEFDFYNYWAGFGLDDVSVAPAPAPAFQSVSMTQSNITLTWSGVANLTYRLQSASDLSRPNWTNVAAVSGSGGLVSASVPLGGASHQFYRVILLSSP